MWSGSVACSDGLTWYAVAIFERNCAKKGSFVDFLEGIWQHFEAIDNTISKYLLSAAPYFKIFRHFLLL